MPQAVALAFATASCSAAPATVGAAVGIAATATVTRAGASPPRACTDNSLGGPRSAGRQGQKAARRPDGRPLSKWDPATAQARVPSGVANAAVRGGSADGEHGLGRWRPFLATVPAWTATLLLMLEPVKLLVRVFAHVTT